MTPSPSVSFAGGQPLASTVVPGGVCGHLSNPSPTPSLSSSAGQPNESTGVPAGVSGQAALLVYVGAGRCVGAFVDAVEHLVTVLIVRAAGRIDGGASRGVGTCIDAVEHAVGILVGGTATIVDGRAEWRVGAGVLLVGNAILLGIRRRRPVRLEEREPCRSDEV